MNPEIAQAIRNALEQLAQELETRAGNKVYRQAWRAAAKLIREKKPN